MAPKKTKKTADSINSRLALVMKSGKGEQASSPLLGQILTHITSYSRLQVNPQDSPIWKGQARHHCWKHTTPPKERVGM